MPKSKFEVVTKKCWILKSKFELPTFIMRSTNSNFKLDTQILTWAFKIQSTDINIWMPNLKFGLPTFFLKSSNSNFKLSTHNLNQAPTKNLQHGIVNFMAKTHTFIWWQTIHKLQRKAKWWESWCLTVQRSHQSTHTITLQLSLY